jgi:hypothetical protein
MMPWWPCRCWWSRLTMQMVGDPLGRCLTLWSTRHPSSPAYMEIMTNPDTIQPTPPSYAV